MSTPSQPNPTIAPNSQSQVESSQGCNTSSQPAPSIAPSSQVGTSHNSQIAGQPDPFDDPDPDEYVGVNDDDDDEAMLLTVHEELIGPDHILEDEEAFIDDAINTERVIVYDPKNLKIEKTFSCKFWMWEEDYEKYLRDIEVVGMRSDPEHDLSDPNRIITRFDNEIGKLNKQISEIIALARKIIFLLFINVVVIISILVVIMRK